MGFAPNDIARFHSKIARCAPADCWDWIAGLRGAGRNSYGAFWAQGRMWKAHRIAYQLVNGPVSSDVVIRHTCDRPRCCNPNHLIAGTVADNNYDKALRGRAPRITGARHGRHTRPEATARGSRHGNAVLDEIKVRDIKRRLRAGESRTGIASVFGVSKRTIQFIASGQTWRHV
jgi:hypothetical protein